MPSLHVPLPGPFSLRLHPEMCPPPTPSTPFPRSSMPLPLAYTNVPFLLYKYVLFLAYINVLFLVYMIYYIFRLPA